MADLKISYDHNAADIMDGVNAVLSRIGYTFEDDGKEHDGYCLFALVKTEPDARPPKLPRSMSP